jgi:hypothetical protein
MFRSSACRLLLVGAATLFPLLAQGSLIPLDGHWRFRLDAENDGHRMQWQSQRFEGASAFLPGSTDQAGYGLKIDSASRGYLSRPYFYEGAAWYQRDIVIPAQWSGKRVALFLERPHWQTEVWVDGKPYGMQNSLAAPHVYDLGAGLAPGAHTLTLCVDNSYKIDVGRNAHSVTEHTQTNWNGVIGRIELQATDPVWIEEVWIETSAANKAAKVTATIRNSTGKPVAGQLTANRGAAKQAVQFAGAEQEITMTVPFGTEAKLWDEHEGNLHTLDLALIAGDFRHEWSGRVGLREIGTKNKQFLLNGRAVFLRGTLECNIFPLTAYPPMNKDEWARLFRIARSYGLNHFRFHSWCPPEAAFTAADEAGFLLHVEIPVWNRSVGKDPKVVEYMRAEGERIQRSYGNHPSFTMMCLGNELAGDYNLMDQMVAELKQRDPRRLYAFSADFERMGPGPSSDYYVAQKAKNGYFRIHGSRFGNANSSTDVDFSNLTPGINTPVLAHELGQWVTYPDYAEIGKYQGVLKPRNLETFRAALESRGMLDQAKAFQAASGRFAWLLYKEDVETALRTPNFGGVQLLQLQDFPGQGEALIGLLDSFWGSKGLFEPEQVRGFFGQTVTLARFTKYTWTNDENFVARLSVAHYGKADIPGAVVEWSVRDDAGRIVASGRTAASRLQRGEVTGVGEARVPLAPISQAARLRLETRLAGTAEKNWWDVWVYPKQVADAAGDVIVTSSLAEAKQRLAQGRKVLLQLPRGQKGRNITQTRFLPVFWSLSWFPKQPGHLGILCDPAHPSLAGFPTDFHSNFNWWELTQDAPVFLLNDTPAEFRPLIQVIDDYHRNHKLGVVFETKAGSGKLLVTSLDLESDLNARLAARQLRRSLLDYMNSSRFNPRLELPSGTLEALFSPQE